MTATAEPTTIASELPTVIVDAISELRRQLTHHESEAQRIRNTLDGIRRTLAEDVGDAAEKPKRRSGGRRRRGLRAVEPAAAVEG